MTPDAIKFVWELMNSRLFPEILTAITEEESRGYLQDIRHQVRSGNIAEAQRILGKLEQIEDLKAVFYNRASRYEVHTER